MICTSEYIKEKFGISPKQYADFKSLTGDTADHIKGAEKVGPKTAALLLNEFDTLENILSHADRIRKPAVRDSIIRNTEKLKVNYKLIKLDDHVSVPFRLQELEYAYSGITTNEVLKGIGCR